MLQYTPYLIQVAIFTKLRHDHKSSYFKVQVLNDGLEIWTHEPQTRRNDVLHFTNEQMLSSSYNGNTTTHYISYNVIWFQSYQSLSSSELPLSIKMSFKWISFPSDDQAPVLYQMGWFFFVTALVLYRKSVSWSLQHFCRKNAFKSIVRVSLK